MRNERRGVYELTGAAMCIALMCVCSYIVIPLPFSPAVLSLHSVAVGLTGLLLRPKNAAAAVCAYLVMGLIGLPVFAGATSGAGKLVGPTGGFYLGFLLSAVLISLLKGSRPAFGRYALACLAAVPVSHACAVAVMCLTGGGDAEAAFLTISLPFIPGDAAKAFLTAAVGKAAVNITTKRR